jgi:hypothetical protein
MLDLRTGVLTREEASGQHRLRSLRMVSASVPGVAAMRAEAGLGRLRAGPPLQPPRGEPMTSGRVAGRHGARVTAGGAGIGAVATQWSGRDGTMRTVDRLASYVAGAHRQPALGSALSALDAAEALGFGRLLAAHRAVWAARWDVVNVWIPDDPSAELALRAVPVVERRQPARSARRRGVRAVRNWLRRACLLGRRRLRATRYGEH